MITRGPGWFLAASASVLMGFQITPIEIGPLTELWTYPWWGVGLFAFVICLPSVPLCLVLFRLFLPRLPRPIAYCLIVLAIVLTVGVILAAGIGSKVGLGVFAIGRAALCCALWGALLYTASSAERLNVLRFGNLLLCAASIAALTSLAGMGAVAASAIKLSEGAPYCIANNSPDAPVKSWAELRWFSFYTTEPGDHPTQAYHFHGILIVAAPGQAERYFNWSPRRWQFDKIPHAVTMATPPAGNCVPVPNFLSGLAIAR